MGGMAEIFRARTATEGFTKRVCIKRVLPNFLEDAEFVTMFRDEAKTAAKLQHGNVVQVFDFGEVADDTGTTLYLAMELVDGADLRRIAEAGRKKGLPFSLGEVVQIGIDVCRGLHHAHTLTENGVALGIVHRDVSPHNVLVSHSGEVKVADFGIARAAERATHTSTGVVKGKVAYMSPEQAEGKAFDHRLDQWALGVILWELLCGARLFTGDNDIAVLRRILGHEVPAPSSRRGDVPAALDDIVLRALAFHPDDRFPDLRAMEQALQRFLFSGAIDPATASVRDVFPRILEARSGPPQPLRRTNVIGADAVLSPSLLAPAPATLVAPADSDSTEPEPDDPDAPARSDISIVFTHSGKAPLSPASSPSSVPSSSVPSSSVPSSSVPSSSVPPQVPSPVTEVEDGALAAEVRRLLAPDEGTPVTRTVVPAAAATATFVASSASAAARAAPAAPLAATANAAADTGRPRRAAALGVAAALALIVVGGGGVLLSSRAPPPGAAPATTAPLPTATPPASATPATTTTISAVATTTPAAATTTTTTPPAAAATVPATTTTPPAAAATVPATTTTPPAPAAPTTAASPPAAPETTPTAAATAGGWGSAYIEVVGGWATVSAGKKVLGETPLALRLPSGRHTLTLTSGDGGATKTIVVVVPAGGRVRVSESF